MMKYEGLTERELQQKKELLTEVISRNPDKNFQRDNKDSEVWKNYAMGSRIGKQVYRSFSDEELLAYIRCCIGGDKPCAVTEGAVLGIAGIHQVPL